MSTVSNATSAPKPPNSNGDGSPCAFSPIKIYRDLINRSDQAIINSCYSNCSKNKEREIARCQKLKTEPFEETSQRVEECAKLRDDLHSCMLWCVRDYKFSLIN